MSLLILMLEDLDVSLQPEDKFFVFYDCNSIPKNGKYSYFGGNFGTVDGFSQYIAGYVYAAEALFNEYFSCEAHRMDKLDTLIYPMCFIYRQIIELYIKYFYFKYALKEDLDKESFVKRISHKLNKAWIETKPFLAPLLSKINSGIDITIFDEFIDQVDRFDTDSFRMRYPIKKDLSSVHSAAVKLDVVGLHHKMMNFFELFKKMDEEIENVIIDNACSVEFVNNIKNNYKNSSDKIKLVLNKIMIMSEQELCYESSNIEESIVAFDKIEDFADAGREELKKIILDLPSENAAMLGLLTHIGRTIIDRGIKFACDEDERNKDFMKLAELVLVECESFISFDGQYSNLDMCYSLLEKGYNSTVAYLKEAVKLFDEYISKQSEM